MFRKMIIIALIQSCGILFSAAQPKDLESSIDYLISEGHKKIVLDSDSYKKTVEEPLREAWKKEFPEIAFPEQIATMLESTARISQELRDLKASNGDETYTQKKEMQLRAIEGLIRSKLKKLQEQQNLTQTGPVQPKLNQAPAKTTIQSLHGEPQKERQVAIEVPSVYDKELHSKLVNYLEMHLGVRGIRLVLRTKSDGKPVFDIRMKGQEQASGDWYIPATGNFDDVKGDLLNELAGEVDQNNEPLLKGMSQEQIFSEYQAVPKFALWTKMINDAMGSTQYLVGAPEGLRSGKGIGIYFKSNSGKFFHVDTFAPTNAMPLITADQNAPVTTEWMRRWLNVNTIENMKKRTLVVQRTE